MLGEMLHLDIQMGKEAMNTSIFQKYFGETAFCMKILTMATKGFVQLKSNDTYFSDIWFSGVKRLRRRWLWEYIIVGQKRRPTRVFVYLH